jgi:hypothetical protein
MLSREQLESLSLEDLKAIAKHYRVQPLGNHDKAESWMNVLLRFPYRAIDQMREGVGLRSPGNHAVLYLEYMVIPFHKNLDTNTGGVETRNFASGTNSYVSLLT